MTELDDELVPDVLELIDEIGISATFETLPSLTQDVPTSVVTPGAAVNYTEKVSPPLKDLLMLRDEDGVAEQIESRVIYLATGAGTASAIAFTPTRGQKVTVQSEQTRIIELQRLVTGDQVAAWKIWLEQ